jgi:hypothetical protein
MALDAKIIDPMTGEIDPQLSTQIDTEQHAELFAMIGQHPNRFPLLTRMSDYYSDVEYTTEELKSLIAEIEHTAGLLEPGSRVYQFTSPFHSMCFLAFIGRKRIALYAD